MNLEVAEFLEYLSTEKGLSPNTCAAYQRDLEQFAVFARKHKLALPQIDLKDLRAFLAELRGFEVTARTLARKVSTLKQFFQFLLREGEVTANPAELLTVVVKNRRLPKHLTIEEIFQLIEAASQRAADQDTAVRDTAMMELWYATGCRVSELAGVRVSDIDWGAGLVRLQGKGARQRWVPLSQPAVEWARRYLEIRHEWVRRLGLPDTDLFFLTHRGKAFSRQGLWKWLQGIVKQAGLRRKVWPHMIRHSFATHVLQGGADLRAVQELLGHRSISTTEMYTHLNVENLKVMQRKYHPRG